MSDLHMTRYVAAVQTRIHHHDIHHPTYEHLDNYSKRKHGYVIADSRGCVRHHSTRIWSRTQGA